MKLNLKGCAICGATWGDYWEEVEGEKMFFCCDICAIQFKNMIGKIKELTGWPQVDEINIQGDYRGRVCEARSAQESHTFYVSFGARGEVKRFLTLNSIY